MSSKSNTIFPFQYIYHQFPTDQGIQVYPTTQFSLPTPTFKLQSLYYSLYLFDSISMGAPQLFSSLSCELRIIQAKKRGIQVQRFLFCQILLSNEEKSLKYATFKSIGRGISRLKRVLMLLIYRVPIELDFGWVCQDLKES